MPREQVRIWRSADESRVLLMAGRTTGYAVDPRGEYVFGAVSEHAMRSRRGRERRIVEPGRLVAWDPSGSTPGTAVDGQAWSSRLIVVEAGDLAALAGDAESPLAADISFPEPVLADAVLLAGFLRMHRSFDDPATRLERDERLAEWLCALVERSSALRPRRAPLTPRDERALRLARDYLGDLPVHAIGLEELAAAAGIGKFRLVRLFRERTGLPPHAFQVAQRIRAARRLLEAGTPIAEAARATGFSDQSHLHRHFRRSLGVTPGQYQRCFVPPGRGA